MGRRKIEIKAIKDDRNRSVTFLKRKGGLFKKAHELSVLCSVDVAVIIFGNNKKLYEYSSSDIGEILTRYQYYGGPNEHKGPADFNGKGGKDDDDDDDDGSGMSMHGGHQGSVEPQMMPPHFQNQPGFQHIRHQAPSASPPIGNGAFLPQQQRQHTPQPLSRPSSRNANPNGGPMNGNPVIIPRRQSSNLVPQQHPQPQPAGGYAYMPNPAIYNPQQPGIPPHAQGLPPHMQQHQQMQAPPQGIPQGQYPNYGPPPQQQHPQQQIQHQQQQAQAQHMYAEEQRRSSMPPVYAQVERPPSRPESSPPQQPQQQFHVPQQPAVKQEQDESPQPPQQQQLLEPVKRMSVKSRSIFTPIDESRSILSQHWATSNSSAGSDMTSSNLRSQSVDAGAISRSNNSPPQPARGLPQQKTRMSMSSAPAPEGFHPPSRTNSASLGGKRPVLKVQIPEEGSENGSPVENTNSSPRSSTNPSTTRRNEGSGVVLPPPSPSGASALLSAGASGPPNPFARPHHPNSQPSQSNMSNMIDTPVSALPSRFMNQEFLPSPSSFYPEWNFNGRENTLASPLNFATPVVGTGPSFLREDSGERANGKRKTPEHDGGSGEENGGGKRIKQ